MNTLIVITWALIGTVIGGMLGGELADLGANHRGDIGALFIGGMMGALLGAAGLGWLGWVLAVKFAADRPKLNWVAGGPWIAAGVVVLTIVLWPEWR